MRATAASDPTYERLAYEAAQRALDKRERLLDELRSRTGLLPKSEKFIFALVGAGLYEGLYEVKDDLAEVYRRLSYNLDRFWDANDLEMQKLFTAFRLATGGIALEIVVLIAMVSDNLF